MAGPHLAAKSPGAFRPAAARTLNNLTILYRDSQRLADAALPGGIALWRGWEERYAVS